MIRWFEDKVISAFIRKPFPQPDYFALKFIRHEDLMGKGGEGEVEIVGKAPGCQLLWL